MASVHVQYESDSDDSEMRDDFAGTDSDGDSGGRDNDGILHSDQEIADDESKTDSHTKSGLADAMSKILRKSVPGSKQVVLARGQTDRQIQRKRKKQAKDTVTDKETAGKRKLSTDSEDTDSDDDSPEARRKLREKQQQRKEWEEMARVKPDVLEKEKERSLQKIATRGVVQLFNAVRQQQSMLGDKLSEAGSSERRREKVLSSANKKNFLNLLDSVTPASLGAGAKTKAERKSQSSREDEDEADRSGSWGILRDDFMMGAKMKDWDRAGDSDGEGQRGRDVGSDALSDSD